MATLVGRNRSGSIKLDIAPVVSALSGQDAEEYDIQIWPADENGARLIRRFSVQGWQMKQDDVWVFARAFAEAEAVMLTTVPIDLWRTGHGQPADLCVSAWWASVRLRGVKPQNKIRATLLIAEDSDCKLFRQFSIVSRVEEVVQFGNELEKEIILASPGWAEERELEAT